MTLHTRFSRMALVALLCATTVALWPSEASAQRRGGGGGGRSGPGPGPRGGGRVVTVVSPRFYGGYGYNPFFWGGWGPWGYPGWYGGGYGYMGGAMWNINTASARLQVTPRSAEVYIDGYLAGNVDNFDGVFQRLNLAPGAHELIVYQDGYKPITQRVLFRPGVRFDLKQDMVPLAAGEPNAPRPQGAIREVPEQTPVDEAPLVEPSTQRNTDFGTLAIRVQPRDATLFIDGEEWTAPESASPVTIELSEGTHDIEVRKDGLTTFRRTVQVRGGQTVSLNVSLSR